MAAMELFDEAIDEAGEPMDVARLEGYRGILDKIIHDDILLNVMTSRLDIGRITSGSQVNAGYVTVTINGVAYKLLAAT